MAIRVSSHSVTVGAEQELSIAQGEDREFRLTFTDGGSAVDMSTATAVVMTVRNRTNGILLFARNYSGFVSGTGSSGNPKFLITQSDTAEIEAGPYDVDVSWTDSSGYKAQVLVASTFLVLKAVGDADDDVTTPPAIPVVYGLTWSGEWTGKSGGYNLNDAVMAYDGGLGATAISTFRSVAQGVTYHPMTGSSPTLATGWAYIGQHGGQGVTGPTGPQGPTGVVGPTLTATLFGPSGIGVFLDGGDFGGRHFLSRGMPTLTTYTDVASGLVASFTGYDDGGRIRINSNRVSSGVGFLEMQFGMPYDPEEFASVTLTPADAITANQTMGSSRQFFVATATPSGFSIGITSAVVSPIAWHFYYTVRAGRSS